MNRPGYREAIEWMVLNDDCSWLDDDEPIISVTAAMVRDLWNVSDHKLFADMRRRQQREQT